MESTYSCSGEAQGELAGVGAGEPEVVADAFSVPEVEVAVGLGREAGADDRPVADGPPATRGDIRINDLLDEMLCRVRHAG